jgi:hypothetical protein
MVSTPPPGEPKTDHLHVQLIMSSAPGKSLEPRVQVSLCGWEGRVLWQAGMLVHTVASKVPWPGFHRETSRYSAPGPPWTLPYELLPFAFFFFFFSTEVWTQDLHLQPIHHPFFVIFFFSKVRSCELLAWAGFKPWSSWSAKIIGLNHWHSVFPSLFNLHPFTKINRVCATAFTEFCWAFYCTESKEFWGPLNLQLVSGVRADLQAGLPLTSGKHWKAWQLAFRGSEV